MRSSYRENAYAGLFSGLVCTHKPKLIVECGVLDGYSLIAMANATTAPVIGIDLFEGYEHKSAKMDTVWGHVQQHGRQKNITLVRYDAFRAANLFGPGSIDMLHLDISNTGQVILDFWSAWSGKLSDNGVFLFEGGSRDRDNVEWMLRWNKPKIALAKNELENRGLNVFTFEPFPSLTICTREIR